MKNPFNPSFGKMPSVFLNRGSLEKLVCDELEDPNSPFQTSLIYGQRGSGKTTLMTNIANVLSQKEDWYVINLVLNDNILVSLINKLKKKVKSSFSLNKVDLKLGVESFGVKAGFSSEEPENFQILLEEYLEKLNKQGIKVLITIDEIKMTSKLRTLVSYYQLMLRENYHLALLMAGLPENVSELQNDSVLTFLLRANRIVLDPLSAKSIMDSYHHIFTYAGYSINHETVIFMTKQTLGFAYAFQLLGYWTWEKAEKVGVKEITIDLVQDILENYISDLDRNVYYKVYTEMTAKEQEFVQTMTKIGGEKVKITEIGKIMNRKPNYISVYRRKLIDNQVIKSAGYGYVSFLLPHFNQFIEDQMLYNEF